MQLKTTTENALDGWAKLPTWSWITKPDAVRARSAAGVPARLGAKKGCLSFLRSRC